MSVIKKRSRELLLIAIIILIGVVVSIRTPAFFSIIKHRLSYAVLDASCRIVKLKLCK